MGGRGWAIIHLIGVGLWVACIPAAFVLGWWESVPFVVFASIYANVVGHWGAYQAARAERKQDEQS